MTSKVPSRRKACTAGAGVSALRGAALTLSLVLAACGGGGGGGSTPVATNAPTTPPTTSEQTPPTTNEQTPPVARSIGGGVTGLKGSGLVLQNGAGDDLEVAADGNFVFSKRVDSGSAYVVSVKAQPTNPTQICTVNKGAGTAPTADVTDVAVVCATQSFTVGGKVTGLSGTGLVLQNNAGDDVAITADGRFTFSTPVASTADYAVTVKSQPGTPPQTCTVSNGFGKVSSVPVDNVEVTCAIDSFTVGGTVTGFQGVPPFGFGLYLNGTMPLYISGNGTFTFPSPVASGAAFSVTVAAQPVNPPQVCTVSNGTGTMGTSNVTNLQVACAMKTYNVRVNVTGLDGKGLVLQNNGGDDLALTLPGVFDFATPVVANSTYNVSVKTQPKAIDQTCTVANGIGSSAVDTTLDVTCVSPQGMFAYISRGGSSGQQGIYPHAILNGNVNFGYSPYGSTSTPIRKSVLHPDGNTVYALGSDFIHRYTVLNPAGVGVGFRDMFPATSTVGQAMAIDPLGRFLFVTDVGGNAIYAVALNSDGSWVGIGLGLPTGSDPMDVVVDPTGRFVYVANRNTNTISAYSIPSTYLGFTPIGEFPTDASPDSLAISPDGKHLYVGSSGTGTVTHQHVLADGRLQFASNFPLIVPVQKLAVHPNGRFLIAALGSPSGAVEVNSYEFYPSGDLWIQRGTQYTTAGTVFADLAVDPSGKWIYALSIDRVETMRFTAAGAISANTTTLLPAGGPAASIAIGRR